MTEIFGPIGEGWKYEVVSHEIVPGHGDESVMMVVINLYVMVVDGGWSDPIPGVGASMYTVAETNGIHTNDEAIKMALTDALSVSMKQLGVGSLVYEGRMDSKYAPPAEVPRQLRKPGNLETCKKVLEKAAKEGYAAVKEAWGEFGVDVKEWIKQHEAQWNEDVREAARLADLDKQETITEDA